MFALPTGALETQAATERTQVWLPVGAAVALLVTYQQVDAQSHVDAVANATAAARTSHVQAQANEARDALRATAEEARRPKFVKPAQGVFTSGFGARWGAMHNGVDIADSIGTPILSVADGVVIEAGPASGFGLWVRVRHPDGTITVYGHVDRILASAGTVVRAGTQIATMGNRGQSTGPHLHFEVWEGGSRKIDPFGWLATRGISL